MALLLCHSCDTDGEKQQIGTFATQFAQDYFNCRYRQALQSCTPESAKWLHYAASNITQADLDVLNSRDKEATCDVVDIATTSDSTSVATLKIKDFFLLDSIGKPGTINDEALLELTMKRAGDKWQVQLSALPRPRK